MKGERDGGRADDSVGPSPLLVWNGAVTRLRRIGVEKPETTLVSTTDARPRDGRESIRSAPLTRSHA